MWRNATARTLADLTGGRYYANRLRNAVADMDRIDQATRSGYLIGYYPANPAMDGKYRSITVRVDRPGAAVIYRHGYFARPAAGPFDPEAMMIYSRVASAANYAGEIPDIKLQAAASATTGSAGSSTDLRLTIDPARMSFTKRDGRNVASFELAAFLLGDKDRLVGQMWKAFDFSFDDARLQLALREGVPMTFTVAVTAAPKRVKVILYDPGADLLGSANIKMK
jgi:hypothetical protein